MKCDKKFLARYAWVRFIKLKSLSCDLMEGYWECEKRVVMLGCLCKALLRGGCDTFAK